MRYDSTAYTDEALAVWAQRNPDSMRDVLNDSRTHDRHQSMRDALDRAERAMRAEGVEPAVRLRVINTVVFGGPDPDQERSADETRRVRRQLKRDMLAIQDFVVRPAEGPGSCGSI